jgi:hypothetical protein
VSIAWGLLNDSYLSSHTLAYEPYILSCACLHIGIECCQKMSPTSEVRPQIPSQWWTLLGIESDKFWSCVRYLTDLQYAAIIDRESELQKSEEEQEMVRIEVMVPDGKNLVK